MLNSRNFAACAEKSAFVIGFTGECGKEVTRELLDKKIFKKVVLIGRRHVAYEDPLYTNVEQRVIDFENIENHKDAFKGCEYGFCCLGTRKEFHKTNEEYARVDHDYVVNSAKVAHEMGCKRISLVSSADAKKDSWFFYLKLKGLIEYDISEIPFEKVTIARPGLLLSDRVYPRLSEKIAVLALKPIVWAKPTLLSIPTIKVAKAMIFNMCSDQIEQRVDILSNSKMHEIADSLFDKTFGAPTSASG